MVTTSSSRSPSPPDSSLVSEAEGTGFLPLLFKSVFEPGVNSALIMAMNVSFFLLILVLFALSFVTGWNLHVLFLLGVSTVMWFTMIWFVMEISKVQTRPDNMPPTDLVAEVDRPPDQAVTEPKKDR